jgi:hypothetical protein
VTAVVGRNEPCPCGSGKKYKRCCALKKDDLTLGSRLWLGAIVVMLLIGAYFALTSLA